MKESLIQLANKYGWFVIAGLIGAVVHRIRNSMSMRRFIGILVVSGFVGFCVGVILRNYLSAPQEVIFVACSISGVFSQDILNELQQVIRHISVYAKGIMNKHK